MLFEAIGPGGAQESPFPASAYGVCRTFQQQRSVRRRGIGIQGIVPYAQVRNCRGIRGAPEIGSFLPILRCAAAAKMQNEYGCQKNIADYLFHGICASPIL